jgi:hypothetical protein
VSVNPRLVAQAAKAAKQADKAAEVGRRAADAAEANQSRVFGDLNLKAEEIMAEHNASLKGLSAEQEIAGAKSKLDAQVESARQAARERTLYFPEAGVNYSVQTRNPEEFTRRVRDQLFDPVYAQRTISDEMNEVVTMESLQAMNQFPIDKLEESRQLWQDLNVRMTTLLKDPVSTPLINFSNGTAYTRRNVFGDTGPDADLPVFFYHMDTMTDPNLGRFGEIQRSAGAHEFGNHVGTHTAANLFAEVKTSPRLGRGAIVEMLTKVEDFIELETGVQPRIREQIQEIFEAAASNTFIRPGQTITDFSDLRIELNEAITEIFNVHGDLWQEAIDSSIASLKTDPQFKKNLKSFQQSNLVRDLEVTAGALDPDTLTTGLLNRLMKQFNSSGYPVTTNVKNGLLMPDIQSWMAEDIARNLNALNIFPGKYDELAAIQSMQDNTRQNLALQQFLKDQGYDHIIYPNMAEDKGSFSLLLFDPDTWQNAYSPNFARGKAKAGQAAAAAGFTAPLAGLLGLEEGG